jgi:phage-related minor tail protein
MQPQGQSLIDTSYFTSLTAQINGIQGTGACAVLQEVVNDAAASINAGLAAIRAQITALLPATQLPTASLGSIVTWIENFAEPLIKAYNNLIATEAAILSAVASLVAAITAAAARLVSCSITIPTIA